MTWNTGLCPWYIADFLPCFGFGQTYQLAADPRDLDAWKWPCCAMCGLCGCCVGQGLCYCWNEDDASENEKPRNRCCLCTCACIEAVLCCYVCVSNRRAIGEATGAYTAEDINSCWHLVDQMWGCLCCALAIPQQLHALEKRNNGDGTLNLNRKLEPAPYVGPYIGLVDIKPEAPSHMVRS